MHHLPDLVRYVCAWLKVDSEKGATALEYGLLAAGIAAAIAVAVGTIGTNITAVFTSVAAKIHT
ncbi:MAG: Flp family type IVb pilin [Rhodomicrobium sp.]|jgi:pilus assembly protein Flp/PilA